MAHTCVTVRAEKPKRRHKERLAHDEIRLSSAAANRAEFLRHGLADMTSLEALQDGEVLFSTDGRLCNEARVAGKMAINFAQYREEFIEEQRELKDTNKLGDVIAAT